jgi:hypothetical protein
MTEPSNMPTPNEPLLRSGINFTNRAEMKYARAVHLANELRGRIDEWSASETLLAELHQVDEHAVEFRIVVKAPPPIDEWSLILGDALHNLRGVLDAVVWGLATLDGAEPIKPRRVAFVVTQDQAEWAQQVKNLESVPAVYLERLRRLQPWMEGVTREDSLLWLLHRLDILDKHRALISGKLRLERVGTGNLDLKMEPAETASGSDLVYEMQRAPVEIQNGVMALRIRSATHTLHPDPSQLATLTPGFSVVSDDGREFILAGFLGDVISRTREWLDRLMGGDAFALAQKESRQSTDATAVSGYLDESGRVRILKAYFKEETPLPGPPELESTVDQFP